MKFQERFDNQFIKKPGEHILIIGITGSGKTQILLWISTRIMAFTNETLIWFDIGKKSESFFIPQWLKKESENLKTKIILPEGCEIRNLPFDYEIDYFYYPNEILEKIERDRFNIVSIQPFIIDPGLYTKIIDILFRDLIRKAHNYYFEEEKGIGPLSLIFDEFHNIAPAQGHTMSPEQNQTGALIQMNVEKLRAFGIRIIGSSQGETKIRKGVRISFNWRVYRRTSEQITDIHRLTKFEEKIQHLAINEAMVVFPSKDFEIISLEELKYPSFTKNIQYRGLYEIDLEPQKINKRYLATREMYKMLRYEFGISQKDLAKRVKLDKRDLYYFEHGS